MSNGRGEAVGEHLAGQRIYHIVQRVMRGIAALTGQKPPQEGQLPEAPLADPDEVIRPGIVPQRTINSTSGD